MADNDSAEMKTRREMGIIDLDSGSALSKRARRERSQKEEIKAVGRGEPSNKQL